MTTDMKQEVERIAESVGDWVEAIQGLFQGEATDPEEWGEYSDPLDFVAESVLELYANTRQYSQAGAPDVREVVVVLGTGGPHRELVATWRGDLIGRAYWGRDSAERYLDCDQGLADYLLEYLGFEDWG